ncbi:probable F420-dependent oxidoreductase, Rv2161c family [Pseudonocardia thermophila]|uniref:Probable F420-dependent oxidoreductase, Rv2161c family n=1 Tax=Pseudonocardia thermophila TaxID=1848 RepID=A0A1M6T9S6_PSETH|nr:LLM class flavin-dependent oxidoreductase [Pseudonocardia thermophila]SHK53727.1 probable F420-dependent oxidoreductase, Rv2161c family [Pseudonocardia thermophila]
MGRKFGVGLYTGQHSDYRDVVPLAVAAEEAGFDSFWVTEHHGLPDGYLPSPLTMLAALAPVTERIQLGTGVVLAPLHHPLRLAEDAAVVDRLCGGRLILGLGLGYAAHEYRAFGVDPATRGARLSALIGALRQAWTGKEFDCPELGLHGVRVTPTPAHPIPIWLGGYAAAAVRRAGQLADGHLVGRGEPHIVDAASEQLATVRDPADATFTRAVNITCILDGAGAESARAAFSRQQRAYEEIQAGRAVYADLVSGPHADIDAYVQVSGDADDVVAGVRSVLERLRDWADVHLVLRVLFPEPLEVTRERLAIFGREVLPRLREE